MTSDWGAGDELPPPRGRAIAPSPRLLLFDLDDTLCDYASAHAARLRLAFSLDLERDPTAPARDLDRMIADSLVADPHGADHFPELFRHHRLPPAAAEAAMVWYRANRFHGLALFADAAATLEALRRAQPDRPIGLVTNGPAEIQRSKLDLLGVLPLVDFVVISGEFGAWKPDPTIFREALRLGNATPDNAIFIGDSAEHDIAGAQAAGIRAAWVNRTGQPWAHPAPPPDFELESLTALLPILGVAELVGR